MIPNIVFTIITAIRPPHQIIILENITQANCSVTGKHITVDSLSNYTLILLAAIYAAIFLVLSVYIGFRSCTIKQKNFNDSCQVIFLLGFIFVNLCILASLHPIFLLRRKEHIARSISASGVLIFAVTFQLVLFFPKLV